MTLLENLKEYYSKLLIIQYNKPKAVAHIKLVADLLLCNLVLLSIRDGFDILTAVGKQLDIIGKIIGVDRLYNGYKYDDEPVFCFLEYNDTTPESNEYGFTTYSTIEDDWGTFFTYYDLLPQGNKLDDTLFRLLIRTKIKQNSIDHSCKNIDDALYEIYGNGVTLSSHGQMVVIYFITDQYWNLAKVLLKKSLLLVPMGVNIAGLIKVRSDYFSMIHYDNTTPVDDQYGFATYPTVSTDLGYFLGYSDVYTD